MIKIKRIDIILIAIFAAGAAFLAFNQGSRNFASRFMKARELKKSIESANYQKSLLEKSLYNLENEPSYLERMARDELKVIAPGEIEYRFLSEEEEEKAEKKPK
ncbi:MAG: septum formation initiator family protein [Endomicrobium sp.]|jgi:cell division protein FtsB|nr:septum formation initiator family protein [Endomicrobium sp.]